MIGIQRKLPKIGSVIELGLMKRLKPSSIWIALDTYDAEHSTLEETRYNLIGNSSRRLLFIVYTEPNENLIHIISARKAEQKQQKAYE